MVGGVKIWGMMRRGIVGTALVVAASALTGCPKQPGCYFPERVCEECGRYDRVNAQLRIALEASELDRTLINSSEKCLDGDLSLTLQAAGATVGAAEGALVACVRTNVEVNERQETFLQDEVRKAVASVPQADRDGWTKCYLRNLNPDDRPIVYVLDSYGYRYDKHDDQRNAVKIANHLGANMDGVEIRKEELYAQWGGDSRIAEAAPSVVVVHISSFYAEGDDPDRRDERFKNFIDNIVQGTSNTRIIAYTRPPSHDADNHLLERYGKLRGFLCGDDLVGRVELWEVPGGPKASFNDGGTLAELEKRVRAQLHQEPVDETACADL